MALKVLILSTLFPDMARPNFGVFVERQARELASREEAHVTVIAPVGIPPWPLSRAKRYDALRHLPLRERWRDLTVHRPRFMTIPLVGSRINIWSMRWAIGPVIRRLNGERPFDVIDASFFYPDGPVAATFAKKLGIPLSIKARGADIHYWGKRADTAGAVLKAGKAANGLLAVSAAMRRSMIALGMEEAKIAVHYTGVDLDRFQPIGRDQAKTELSLSGPVLLCVGALIPRKGQQLLVRALTHLPGVTLILAGEGAERDPIEALAKELGVSDRVGIKGAIPHDQLPLLYSAANVSALVSSSEGLANAWVESLACGTPIVISDVGGARELLDRPAAGQIVEREPEAIAAAVQALLDNPPERQATRETALRFTWQANGDALLAHLQGIAAKD